MMIANIAVVSVTFASVTMLLAALGMFLRDMFAPPPDTARLRLTLAPVEPAGTIDGASVRFRSAMDEAHGDALYFTFAGTLAGETLSGTVDMGEYLGARFTARRAAGEANRT